MLYNVNNSILLTKLNIKLNNFLPPYQHQHHNAPPSSLLSMEECLLAEVQLPTPVTLATHWVAPLHVPVRPMECGLELHHLAVRVFSKWSSYNVSVLLPSPHYAVQCPALSNPTNGRVSVPSRAVGSRATYSCNTGYTLSGFSSRSCLSNGVWSGSVPICSSGKRISLILPDDLYY